MQLKELPWSFTGPLPAEDNDETRIPVHEDGIASDPLSAGETSAALALDLGRWGWVAHLLGDIIASSKAGRHMVCKLLVQVDEACHD